MAQAPDGDDILTVDDAVDIQDEILPAQTKSYELGLKLLPHYIVDAIHSKDLSPEKYLLKILIAFLKQGGKLRPTWRVIVDALRSRAVGCADLANEVEAAHFPNPTASREITGIERAEDEVKSKPSSQFIPVIAGGNESRVSSTKSVVTKAVTDDVVKSKPSVHPLTPATTTGGKELCVISMNKEISDRITDLEEMFDRLKNSIRECLEKKGVLVNRVADVLTSISADEDDHHKMFLESHTAVLFRAANLSELFGTMNFHWNYLNPPLLEHLVKKFKLEEVKGEIESYKSDLQRFIKETPLTVFCRTQKRRRLRLSPEFREMVAEFDWPEDQTLMLEIVEQFRQEYASQYNLRDCAMMVAQIRPGSFIITWIIPESIVKVLKGKPARAVLKKFSVTRLDIDGVCVYRQRKPLENIPVVSSGAEKGVSSTTKPKPAPISQAKPQSEEDYLYVEQPSEDFFCPVMMGLLLQPHLTSCCGNHLSQEAAERIQGERGVCPLCKEKHWSTMLDKRFQRQINSLRVFCCHEERGCGWQGEVASYQSHVKSCPFAGGPLMTELAKLPVYSEERALETPIPEASGVLRTAMSSPIHEGFSPSPEGFLPKRQLNVHCHNKGGAPVAMRRGFAISDGIFAYFTSLGSYDIYQYNYNTEQWKKLPECPYHDSGLTIINGELTSVGGSYTNKLLTLQGSFWIEKYPPMKIGRSHPAVVTIEDCTFVIVIGGEFISQYSLHIGWSDTMEVLNGRKRKWHTLRDIHIPEPLTYPSATISGNQLYVIGRGPTSGGYSALFIARDLITSSLVIQPWNPLPPLPVKNSTLATLSRQLVLVGGEVTLCPGSFLGGGEGKEPGNKARDEDAVRQVDSIYQLVGRQWVEIGSMNMTRSTCLVVNQSPDKIIIVGGEGGYYNMEECIVLSPPYYIDDDSWPLSSFV